MENTSWVTVSLKSQIEVCLFSSLVGPIDADESFHPEKKELGEF